MLLSIFNAQMNADRQGVRERERDGVKQKLNKIRKHGAERWHTIGTTITSIFSHSDRAQIIEYTFFALMVQMKNKQTTTWTNYNKWKMREREFDRAIDWDSWTKKRNEQNKTIFNSSSNGFNSVDLWCIFFRSFLCLSAFVHDSFFSVICSSGFTFLVCLSHIWCSVNNFDTIFLVVFSLPHMWTISTTNLTFSLFYFPGSSSSLSPILRFSCSCFLFLFSAWLVCCVLIFSFACFECVFCSVSCMWECEWVSRDDSDDQSGWFSHRKHSIRVESTHAERQLLVFG